MGTRSTGGGAIASVLLLLCAVISGCDEGGDLDPPREPCAKSYIATVDLQTRETTLGPPLDSFADRLIQAGGETWALARDSWRLVDSDGQLTGPLGGFGRTLGFADIDGDGDLDVALFGAGRVSVFERSGSTLVEHTVLEAGIGSSTLGALADVNGDDAIDLLVSVDGGLSVALGDGAFGFELANGLTRGGDNQWWAGAADVNEDDILDFVAVVSPIVSPIGDPGEVSVSVWLGQGAGVFSQPARYALLGGRAVGGVATRLVDFDRDGSLDIVMRRESRLLFAPGGEGGTFGTARVITDKLGPGGPSSLVIEPHDPNGDGAYDFIVLDSGAIAIVVDDGAGQIDVESLPVPFGGGEALAARVTSPLSRTVQFVLLDDQCPVE